MNLRVLAPQEVYNLVIHQYFSFAREFPTRHSSPLCKTEIQYTKMVSVACMVCSLLVLSVVYGDARSFKPPEIIVDVPTSPSPCENIQKTNVTLFLQKEHRAALFVSKKKLRIESGCQDHAFPNKMLNFCSQEVAFCDERRRRRGKIQRYCLAMRESGALTTYAVSVSDQDLYKHLKALRRKELTTLFRTHRPKNTCIHNITSGLRLRNCESPIISSGLRHEKFISISSTNTAYKLRNAQFRVMNKNFTACSQSPGRYFQRSGVDVETKATTISIYSTSQQDHNNFKPKNCPTKAFTSETCNAYCRGGPERICKGDHCPCRNTRLREFYILQK